MEADPADMGTAPASDIANLDLDTKGSVSTTSETEEKPETLADMGHVRQWTEQEGILLPHIAILIVRQDLTASEIASVVDSDAIRISEITTNKQILALTAKIALF